MRAACALLPALVAAQQPGGGPPGGGPPGGMPPPCAMGALQCVMMNNLIPQLQAIGGDFHHGGPTHQMNAICSMEGVLQPCGDKLKESAQQCLTDPHVQEEIVHEFPLMHKLDDAGLLNDGTTELAQSLVGAVFDCAPEMCEQGALAKGKMRAIAGLARKLLLVRAKAARNLKRGLIRQENMEEEVDGCMDRHSHNFESCMESNGWTEDSFKGAMTAPPEDGIDTDFFCSKIKPLAPCGHVLVSTIDECGAKVLEGAGLDLSVVNPLKTLKCFLGEVATVICDVEPAARAKSRAVAIARGVVPHITKYAARPQGASFGAVAAVAGVAAAAAAAFAVAARRKPAQPAEESAYGTV